MRLTKLLFVSTAYATDPDPSRFTVEDCFVKNQEKISAMLASGDAGDLTAWFKKQCEQVYYSGDPVVISGKLHDAVNGFNDLGRRISGYRKSSTAVLKRLQSEQNHIVRMLLVSVLKIWSNGGPLAMVEPRLRKCFDEVLPELVDIIGSIPVEEKEAVSKYFESRCEDKSHTPEEAAEYELQRQGITALEPFLGQVAEKRSHLLPLDSLKWIYTPNQKIDYSLWNHYTEQIEQLVVDQAREDAPHHVNARGGQLLLKAAEEALECYQTKFQDYAVQIVINNRGKLNFSDQNYCPRISGHEESCPDLDPCKKSLAKVESHIRLMADSELKAELNTILKSIREARQGVLTKLGIFHRDLVMEQQRFVHEAVEDISVNMNLDLRLIVERAVARLSQKENWALIKSETDRWELNPLRFYPLDPYRVARDLSAVEKCFNENVDEVQSMLASANLETPDLERTVGICAERILQALRLVAVEGRFVPADSPLISILKKHYAAPREITARLLAVKNEFDTLPWELQNEEKVEEMTRSVMEIPHAELFAGPELARWKRCPVAIYVSYRWSTAFCEQYHAERAMLLSKGAALTQQDIDEVVARIAGPNQLHQAAAYAWLNPLLSAPVSI